MAIRGLKPVASATSGGAGLLNQCGGDVRRLILLFSLTSAVLLVWLIPSDRDAPTTLLSATNVRPVSTNQVPEAALSEAPASATSPPTDAASPMPGSSDEAHAWVADRVADSPAVVMGNGSAPHGVAAAEEEPADSAMVAAELTPADWGPLADTLGALSACAEVPTPCAREGCGLSPMHPCVNGCACPAPQCIVVNSSACLQSPFWVPFMRNPRAEGRFPIEDGRCITDASHGEGGTDDAPEASEHPVTANHAPTTATVGGRRKTLFPVAGLPLMVGPDGSRVRCAAESENTGFAYEGHGDGAHEFRNVCVRDAGPIARYRGGGNVPAPLDLGLEHGGFSDNKAFNGWTQVTDPPNAGADCLLPASTRPALFFPVAPPADNHMHVFHRFAAAARFLRDRYGDDFRFKVVVVYVIAARARKQLAVLNAYATFYRLLSETWLEVRASAPGGPGRPPIACFEVAHMLSLSKQGRKKAQRSSRVPVISDGTPDQLNGTPLDLMNTGVAFPMFGFRSERDGVTAQLIKRLIHRCFAGSEPRPSPASDKPRLVIAWRTVTRRFAGFAVLLPLIALHWRRLGGGDVRVVEHVGHDPARLVRLHAGADVVAGMIGTGLMWGALLPAGGVVVEFGREYGCSAIRGVSGWGVARECEYGGNSYAFGQHHLTVALPARPQDVAITSEPVPIGTWRRVLDAAFCRLKSSTEECPLGR